MDVILNKDRFLELFNDSVDERKLYAEYRRPENWAMAMNDFARVNVYLADTAMVEMIETPAYPVESLVSNVGGQLGL